MFRLDFLTCLKRHCGLRHLEEGFLSAIRDRRLATCHFKHISVQLEATFQVVKRFRKMQVEFLVSFAVQIRIESNWNEFHKNRLNSGTFWLLFTNLLDAQLSVYFEMNTIFKANLNLHFNNFDYISHVLNLKI